MGISFVFLDYALLGQGWPVGVRAPLLEKIFFLSLEHPHKLQFYCYCKILCVSVYLAS